MAIALVDSIAEVGWDMNDQAERYLKWWRTGAYSVNGRCFDIGTDTVPELHCVSGERERTLGNGFL